MNTNDKKFINIIHRLEAAKRRSGDIIDIPCEHQCSIEFCNPENEQALISKGFLKGPPQCNDIYLCKYRFHHICTSTECNNTELGICKISGTCRGNPGGYSNYDKNNYKTWGDGFRINERTQQCGRNSLNSSIYFKRKIEEVQKEEIKKKPRCKKKNPKNGLSQREQALGCSKSTHVEH